MAEVKYLDLAGLQQYHGLIKKYIDDADKAIDAKSIKTVLWDATTEEIKFYKKQDAELTDTPDYKVSVASSDVATLKEEMLEVQGTLAGYSSTATVAAGIAAAEKNAKDHADAEIKKLAEGAVASNTAAIEAINNTETGILKQAKDYTDALENGQVKTNKEAIEAINNETTGILAVAKKYTDDEIDKVEATIGTVTEGETVVSMIADAKKAGTDADAHLEAYKTTNDAAVKAAHDAADAAQDDVDALKEVVGDMSAVKTTAKTVAGAVDELYDAIDAAEEAGEISLEVAETATEGYLKTYVLSQGETEIGKIDIPKDLVVTSGEVVVNPEGKPAGTYIKLTIANQETPIFINVKDLVEDFTVAKDATEVQLAVSDTREISATLVDGGVSAAKLAADSVITAKIADASVTKAKLATDVQTSLEKADASASKDELDAVEAKIDAVGSIPEEDIAKLFAPAAPQA